MSEIELSFDAKIKPSSNKILSVVAAKIKRPVERIKGFEVVKRSLDARMGRVLYRYRIRYRLEGEPPLERFELKPYLNVTDAADTAEEVVIIGCGPAGLFAALTLLQRGIKPIILERGKDVRTRKIDNATMCRSSVVNPDSNYCFGEGGAGTYSDGKLYTRSTKRGNVEEVLATFVKFGADPDIMIETHAHIGSDRLPAIIENMRKKIVECGGEVHFNTRVTDIFFEALSDGRRWTVAAGEKLFRTKNVILATGHSARDIYELFYEKGWALEAKGFALGVRVEHPQKLINRIRYRNNDNPALPVAEYSVVAQVNGRGVFSFCMCPGGVLVPAATAPGEIVLNGMSNSARSSKLANAGVVVSVNPDDVKDNPLFKGGDPLKLLRFQKRIEQHLFECGDGSLKAPAQRMTDFVNNRMSANLPASSYLCGVYSAPLHTMLPKFIVEALQKGFIEFDKKLKGYYTNDALLVATESRTSSPVRIPRNPNTLEHIDLPGLYPCGEGAGYAGGIVSSAIDGINAARMIEA